MSHRCRDRSAVVKAAVVCKTTGHSDSASWRAASHILTESVIENLRLRRVLTMRSMNRF